MKAQTILALLAGFAALLVITLLSFPVAVSVFFAVGLTALTITDYRRKLVPLRVAAIVARPMSERLRLAA